MNNKITGDTIQVEVANEVYMLLWGQMGGYMLHNKLVGKRYTYLEQLLMVLNK